MPRISNAFLRKASSHDHSRQMARHWQRSLVIECILIALFVAFTASNIMFVLGAKIS